MKRLIPFCFCLFFFASQNLSSQTINGENLADIEYRLSQDSTLYQRLGSRLAQLDSTLTLQELGTLYYGYALRPGYDPVQEERILDAANALARREKYEDTNNLLDNFLGKNPGHLAAQLERAYTAWLLEDSLATVREYRKFYMLLDVPMASGDGGTMARAFMVSSERDMEFIVHELGYFPEKQSLVQNQGRYYYLVTTHLEGDRKQKRNFYFDVSLPMLRGRQQALRK